MEPPYMIVNKIRAIAHRYGSVKSFRAYLEYPEHTTPRSLALRSELQSCGVSLIDCPHNGRKDVADKMMIVDMMAYAIDTPAPTTIFLITGDRDFVYAVSVLALRQYRIVLLAPRSTPGCLKSQAEFVYNWPHDVLPEVPSVPEVLPSVPCEASPPQTTNQPLPAPSLGLLGPWESSHAIPSTSCNRSTIPRPPSVAPVGQISDGGRSRKREPRDAAATPPSSVSGGRPERAHHAARETSPSDTSTLVGSTDSSPAAEALAAGESCSKPFSTKPRPSSLPTTPARVLPPPPPGHPSTPSSTSTTTSAPSTAERKERKSTTAPIVQTNPPPKQPRDDQPKELWHPVVPPEFQPLVDILRQQHDEGLTKVASSQLGSLLSKVVRDRTALFERAGAARLKDYIAQGKNKGIVNLYDDYEDGHFAVGLCWPYVRKKVENAGATPVGRAAASART
ncbi:NYN domain-containing protein [Epithele typhae]|uniref:NYN domain-containing protein n=1 Tax=Epithele typhae TaxID=378194 RepID=UPI0020075F85|nr:NYN domain-containing protein [Epithele typhae]KAH9946317.1 NYN domain-containing protein [Epithele typhae]